ncbi:alkaline phosphatase D family protein [Pseudonocardia acaciae]|uniref:alkaline phosphatase D family protein n=1 Tax=Pseudonocardia acaciae TaxID=551276 RepID=UPI000490A975|nr:alkaline phosphatase D family protein [Pseudonocardia acaciae]
MRLLLGPILRHVDQTSALVWVQTDGPGTVGVLGSTAGTFEVSGHHYALVTVTGLEPDSTTEYGVELDGEPAWPPPGHPFPPPVIRTRGPGTAGRLRAVFGSCRYPKTGEPKLDAKLGLDALDSYAARMATRPVEQWPDALILLGDQVYADELSPTARRLLAAHRKGRALKLSRPPNEVVSFGEYERLYRASWSDPEIRWLLSTVPTAMIFDDHDVRDDWNTSAAWRARMAATPWWRDRIRAALASYVVYQHLGNLTPAALAADPDLRQLLGADGDADRWPLLAELADRADTERDGAKGARFSFRWDLGRTRLIMVDTRNGRILDAGERLMVGEREFGWLAEQAEDDPAGMDHLVIGSSLPWLMPHAIGDLQAVNELAAARPGRRGRLAEWARQAADLEHWAAFARSFAQLTDLIRRVATGRHAPATVTVLSGDVHHSYVARAAPTGAETTVHQLVCSPVHNHVPRVIRPAFRLGWSRRLGALTRRWARRAGAAPLPVRWTKTLGPLYGNTVATLRLDGRGAEVLFEQPTAPAALTEVARVPLG